MVEANMLAPEIPSNHVVSISLIHNGTNTTLCSTNLCIKSLPPTGALHFMGANFIKRLGEIDVKALGTTSNLQMSVTYDPHNAPLELRMAIVVIADAPTL